MREPFDFRTWKSVLIEIHWSSGTVSASSLLRNQQLNKTRPSMKIRALIAVTIAAAIGLSAALTALTAQATEQVEPSAINRIVDEGFNRSQLSQIAAHLTDRIGGRMTNSPQMREAEKWTQEQFRAWGLTNVHLEGFEFGRGWSIEKSSVRMISPRTKVLRSIPIAWTPPTNGVLTAPVVLAPMRRERDFAKWKGTLRGKIVLISKPERSSEPDKPSFERMTDERLIELSEYRQPRHSEAEIARTLKEAKFDDQLDAFLAEEGALAWVRMSYRDAGLVTGEGYGHRVGLTPKLAGIELAAEDYRQLARLTRTDAVPTIEIISDVKYHDEDTKAYNVIADIPGRDPKAGYVMAGAHLDSWVAADGAGDNAAGSAVIMEAARILSKLSIGPKRAIRFALWSGEEQVLGGSLAYIEKHLATRAPSTDPVANELHPYYGWQNRGRSRRARAITIWQPTSTSTMGRGRSAVSMPKAIRPLYPSFANGSSPSKAWVQRRFPPSALAQRTMS